MFERPSVGGLERSFTTGGNAFFVSAVTEAGMFERPPVDGLERSALPSGNAFFAFAEARMCKGKSTGPSTIAVVQS